MGVRSGQRQNCRRIVTQARLLPGRSGQDGDGKGIAQAGMANLISGGSFSAAATRYISRWFIASIPAKKL